MNRILNDLSNLSKNNKASSIYNFGLNSLKLKNYNSAIKSFIEALKQNNSEKFQCIIRPSLAQAYIFNNELEKALNELILTLNLNNTNDGLYYIHSNIGFIYSQIKNYGLAIKEYYNALDYREDAKIYYSISIIYESLFQIEFAIKEIEKALYIDKNNSIYIETYNRLIKSKNLNLTAKRITIQLNTLGLIVIPSFCSSKNKILPLVIYIYPESPLVNILKNGDYIFNIEGFNIDDVLYTDIEEDINIKIYINNNSFSIRTIPKIERKLDEEEKLELYLNWFKTFDYRLVEIFTEKNNDLGKKWGYELESLVRSMSNYNNDKYFKSAFYILLESLYFYKYNDTEEIKYEIDLSKLNFTIISKNLLGFFEDISFIETKKYFENKLKN